LTNLNVQLITDTISADNTFLPATIRTEICQLKIELAEKSNITFNDIKILKKFTFTAPKGLKFIRGDQWEHLIRTYLPQLKEYHFKIHPHLYHTNIEQLLATFQTPFWLKEHQWFVNCDHHHLPNIGYQNLRNVHLYTLPYSDEQFYLTLSTKSVTNVCKDKYSTIKNLYFSIDYHYDTNIAEHYYFPNLDSLTIRNLHKLISINNFINLSQIKHLTIKKNNQINSEQFLSYILVQFERLLPNSHMLDNAPRVRNKTSLYRLQN